MKQNLFLIPEELLEEIKTTQRKILTFFESSNHDELGDYITEAQAKEILKKQTTWFWNMRKTGQLKYSKIGKAIYYSKNDIVMLLKENKN
jgi:hypothetical protein